MVPGLTERDIRAAELRRQMLLVEAFAQRPLPVPIDGRPRRANPALLQAVQAALRLSAQLANARPRLTAPLSPEAAEPTRGL